MDSSIDDEAILVSDASNGILYDRPHQYSITTCFGLGSLLNGPSSIFLSLNSHLYRCDLSSSPKDLISAHQIHFIPSTDTTTPSVRVYCPTIRSLSDNGALMRRVSGPSLEQRLRHLEQSPKKMFPPRGQTALESVSGEEEGTKIIQIPLDKCATLKEGEHICGATLLCVMSGKMEQKKKEREENEEFEQLTLTFKRPDVEHVTSSVVLGLMASNAVQYTVQVDVETDQMGRVEVKKTDRIKNSTIVYISLIAYYIARN